MRSVKDFEQLQSLIAGFVGNVSKDLLFDYPELIDKTFSIIQIVHVLNKIMAKQGNQTRMLKNIQLLTAQFTQLKLNMIRILQNICESGLNQNYNKILLRFNYNDYYVIEDENPTII